MTAAPPSEFWECPACATQNPASAHVGHCVSCGFAPPSAQGNVADFDLDEAVSGRPVGGLSLSPQRSSRRPLRAVDLALAAYAAAVLLIWLIRRSLGDVWWGPTLLLFIPRWPFLIVPVAAAILFAARRRYGRAVVASAFAVFIAGPYMGLSLGKPTAPAATGARLRVMTLNRGTTPLDPARFIELFQHHHPDIICFQETGETPAVTEFLKRNGWHFDATGYIASRFPVVRSLTVPDDPWPEYGLWPAYIRQAVVRTPDREDCLVVNAHMPSPYFGLLVYRRTGMPAVRRFLGWRREQVRAVLRRVHAHERAYPVILAGDFNSPLDSPLLTPIKAEFRDAFADAGLGYDWTRPSRLPWVGIDHVFTSDHWRASAAWVGPSVGSDHRPMIAELVRSERP